MLNRSARAALSFLNDLLFQLTNAFVALVITPLIVANLGADIFGAWRIIQKTTDFLALGNFQPFGLLQLTLAKDISNSDFIYKQQQVGSALGILILTLPIMLILSFLLFYFRDIFITASSEISHQIDLTLLLMLFYTLILPFCSLPGYIVRGVNMHYKRFGINSITTVIGALLQYLVVAKGYALPWFAAVLYFPLFITAIINYIILVKNVPWFKLVWVPLRSTFLFFKKNLWMLLIQVFRYVFSLGDLILIGIYFGTNAAAIYSLTKTLVTFLFMPANSLVTSTLPGVGDLVGRNEKKTLMRLRSEQINVAISLGFVIGIIVMFFNDPFMRLWVGGKYFGGVSLSTWLIVASVVDVLVKVEAVYLDASLILKKQAICLGAVATVYLVMIVLGKPVLGLNVVPIAQIVSQGILIALYWVGFKDCLHDKFSNLARTVLRPLFIAVILTSGVSWIELPVIQNWIELFTQGFKVGILAATLSWFLILKKNDRNILTIRLSNVLERFSKQ